MFPRLGVMGKRKSTLDRGRGELGSRILPWFHMRRGVTLPNSLPNPILLVSVLLDSGRALSGECGLGNSSLQGEDASGTVRGFLFYSLAFLSELPGRKSKNKKLGQRA